MIRRFIKKNWISRVRKVISVEFELWLWQLQRVFDYINCTDRVVAKLLACLCGYQEVFVTRFAQVALSECGYTIVFLSAWTAHCFTSTPKPFSPISYWHLYKYAEVHVCTSVKKKQTLWDLLVRTKNNNFTIKHLFRLMCGNVAMPKLMTPLPLIGTV